MANPTILTVCHEHMISLDEFFGPLRSRHLVEARKAAIAAFRSDGLSLNACARLLRRNKSTICYWLKPNNRAHRLEAMLARKSWKRSERMAA